jgi:hypothetical protein
MALLIGNTPDNNDDYVWADCGVSLQKGALFSGTINEIRVYCISTDSVVVDVAIYSAAGTRLAHATATLSGTIGWRSISIADTDIVKGTNYILLANPSTNWVIGRTATGGIDYDVDWSSTHDPGAGAPPSPLSAWTWAPITTRDVSIQAWGDIAGGPGLFFGKGFI